RALPPAPGGARGAGDAGGGGARRRGAVWGGGVIGGGGWFGLLSRHADSVLSGTCVHADGVGYGTRSAFVLHRAPSAGASRCAWTEARPCTSPAHDGAALLQRMGRW